MHWTRTLILELSGWSQGPSLLLLRRNRSLRTEAGLQPLVPALLPVQGSSCPRHCASETSGRGAEASRAQGALALFLLLTFIQGPGTRCSDRGRWDARGGPGLAPSALGGARRRAWPRLLGNLGPRGIPAGVAGEGRGRFASWQDCRGGSRARTSSRSSPLPGPLKKVDGMLLISSCLLLLRGWRGSVGDRRLLFFGWIVPLVSKSGRFFEGFAQHARDCRLARKSHF